MNIQNKTIIVTGAARIGKEVVRTLAQQGAHLVVSYYQDPTEALVEGVDVHAVQVDVSKQEDLRRLVTEAKGKFGSVNGLVHMAATYINTPWEEVTEMTWNRDMNTIAKSAYLLGKLVGDELLQNPEEGIRGKIILFSDWSVLSRPHISYMPYNVAKVAVVGIMRSLAKELAPHVTVNAIAPGPILMPPDFSKEENREVMKRTPLGRWGGSEEIAKGVSYLFEADFVTGHVLTIDGGRSLS